MSTLTCDGIIAHMDKPLADRLVITPLLSWNQIGDVSVDVRLGNQFIVFRTHLLGTFMPYGTNARTLRRMQRRHVVRFGDKFILHPGMLALGSTFEYFCIPRNLECQVEGRSSWARLGLQIATANSVEPGFKGVLTLELSNVGTIPIELLPGVRIAQLIFHDACPPVRKPHQNRKYRCPIGPEFSRIEKDKDGHRILSAFSS